jgi:hypothetical protein
MASSSSSPAEAVEDAAYQTLPESEAMGLIFFELDGATKDVMFVTTITTIEDIRKFVYEKFGIHPQT